jgi:hypothetical protein
MTPQLPGRALCVLATLSLLASRVAHAEQPRRLQIAGQLGYGFPGGILERGSELSDVTWGLVGLGVDGAYRFSRFWSVGAALSYGASIPKLCATSGDCVSSLGHDFRAGALARWQIGKWQSFEPDVDLELGYEWLVTKLVDNAAVSRRGARGPEATLAAHGQFALWQDVSIGPVLAFSTGIFTRASLDAPGIETERDTDGSTVHFWTFVGFRTSTVW